jgi:dephospho-CoA kinase
MLLVGLTGGIGSGKTTVAGMLRELGAVIIDADDLARQAVDRGTPGYAKVVAQFGQGVLDGNGALDRSALADLVFHDEEARRRLEGIVHPEVARLFAERVAPYRDTDRLVVYSVPLLVERGLGDAFDVVVAVQASEDIRASRLEAQRGMPISAARERMAAQVTDDARRQAADIVIPNDGTLDDLRREVKGLWATLQTRVRTS